MIDTSMMRKRYPAPDHPGDVFADKSTRDTINLLCDILDELRAMRAAERASVEPYEKILDAAVARDVARKRRKVEGTPVCTTFAPCPSCGWKNGHAPDCPIPHASVGGSDAA